MKIRDLILLLAGISAFAGTCFAAGKTPEPPVPPPQPPQERISVSDEGDLPPPPPPQAVSQKDLRLLKSLFTMSDAELRRLRGFIMHLEKMPPERRRQMAADLERAASVKTPEQRKAFEKDMRERFRKNRENLLERYFSSLPKEEADAERKKFLSLDRKQQRAYIIEIRKKLGCEPEPPPVPRK